MGGQEVQGRVYASGCGAPVFGGLGAEAGGAEGKVLADAGDVAGVEGHALGGRLGAYRMTDVVGEGVLGWRRRVVGWEMAA